MHISIAQKNMDFYSLSNAKSLSGEINEEIMLSYK
jgi:hypothetical protein